MSYDTEQLLDWLETQIAGTQPAQDLLERAPELTIDDAYRLQFALMRRKSQRGDRVIGYKAAYTTAAMQKAYGVSGPAVGTLLRSLLLHEDEPIALSRAGRMTLEAEVAALLGRDLVGPGVSAHDALRAVEGFLPAIEIAPPAIGGPKRSRQMGTAVHKLTPGIVVGGTLVSPHGLDLRVEGAVVYINGQPRGSGTAVEALGNPLNVIAHIANVLGGYGEGLSAGMLVMTGSVVPAMPVKPGDRVTVEYSRLGRVRASFAS